MKKIILSLASMLTFSIATAQIDPVQPQQTKPDAVQGVEPDSKNKADTKIAVPLETRADKDNTGVINDRQQRKDEIKTDEHVKSTPDPAVVKDKEERTRKTTKSKKATRN